VTNGPTDANLQRASSHHCSGLEDVVVTMKVLKASVFAAALVALAATGCSSSKSDGNAVKVELGDFSITPAHTSISAGDVIFAAHNKGGFVHELVVMKTTTSDIPVKKNGEANEDAVPQPQHMGEVEDVQPGKTADLKLTLTPGTYVLLCNRTDGTVAHYQKGMHTELSVK
jgi:uncharacterized cupredoxin-like copper-binding protein